MTKIKYIWIYEYKDDNTLIGSTYIDKPLEELDEDDEIKLPHLQEPWHWRISIIWKERRE